MREDPDSKLQYHFLWADGREEAFSEFFYADETIRDVKEKLCRRVNGLQWSDLTLSLPQTSEPLNDLTSLIECKVPPFARIVISSRAIAPALVNTTGVQPSDAGSFQVFIKSMEGRSITMWVNDDTTVRDLKNKVKQAEGLDFDEQRLLFGGKQLNVLDSSLSNYDVQKNVTIQLVGRLRGGH